MYQATVKLITPKKKQWCVSRLLFKCYTLKWKHAILVRVYTQSSDISRFRTSLRMQPHVTRSGNIERFAQILRVVLVYCDAVLLLILKRRGIEKIRAVCFLRMKKVPLYKLLYYWFVQTWDLSHLTVSEQASYRVTDYGSTGADTLAQTMKLINFARTKRDNST